MIVSKVRFIPLMVVMRQDRLELCATNTPILVQDGMEGRNTLVICDGRLISNLIIGGNAFVYIRSKSRVKGG
jgi:hypothetical protein